MDTKTAKRAATNQDAVLEYDRDDKIWNLVAANNEVACLDSQELKILSKEDLEAKIAEMMAVTAEVEKKSPGRKPEYPVRVTPCRIPAKTTPVQVILPNGDTVDGQQNNNYISWLDTKGNPKNTRKTWDGVPERFVDEVLDLRWS